MFNCMFRSESVRLKSFEGWLFPENNILVSRLVLCGFYYSRISDRCICFECGLELTRSEFLNNPWIEHYQWYPNCKFLIEQRNKNISSQDRMVDILVFTGQREYEIRTMEENYMSDETGIFISPPESVNINDFIYDFDLPNNENENGNNIVTNEGESNSPNIENQHQINNERLLCKICFIREIETLLLPCKHLAICKICAENIQECVVCRSIIGLKINVYIS